MGIMGIMGKVLIVWVLQRRPFSFCDCVPRTRVAPVECDGICKMACQGYWCPVK